MSERLTLKLIPFLEFHPERCFFRGLSLDECILAIRYGESPVMAVSSSDSVCMSMVSRGVPSLPELGEAHIIGFYWNARDLGPASSIDSGPAQHLWTTCGAHIVLDSG
jgi:hypothetical protein